MANPLDRSGDTRPFVLVVDDEPLLRRIISGILGDHYRVFPASDGQAALSLFAAVGASLSAVVTDIRMPGMDGVALAAALREMNPSLPILFISGFSVPQDLPGPLLEKPFTPDELLAAVRALTSSGG